MIASPIYGRELELRAKKLSRIEKVLDQIMDFCRSIGGRPMKDEWLGTITVWCTLPTTKKLSFRSYFEGEFELESETDNTSREFTIGKTTLKIIAEKPENIEIEKSRGWDTTKITGNYSFFEVNYRIPKDQLEISFKEKYH